MNNKSEEIARLTAEVARLQAEMQQAREATCTWTYSEDWDGRIEWNGNCGASWQFEDGGPVENEMAHCPTCGKRLVVLPTPPEQEANG